MIIAIAVIVTFWNVLIGKINNNYMENKKPRILVAVPYHRAKGYCLSQLLQKIEKLTFENKDVIMRWDLAKFGGTDNVKKQREYFRKLALSGDYTHLYFLGADTIPPDDVLERLLEHKKDIVGGVYWGRHNANNGKPQGAVAWIHSKTEAYQTRIFSQKNQLLSIDGMGMDSVLISREVLEKISWRSWFQNDDDYPFYDKAKELGYKVYIDTNIQCEHYFSGDGFTYMAEVYE